MKGKYERNEARNEGKYKIMRGKWKRKTGKIKINEGNIVKYVIIIGREVARINVNN